MTGIEPAGICLEGSDLAIEVTLAKDYPVHPCIWGRTIGFILLADTPTDLCRGTEGGRTPNLRGASATLSQLSYGPM